MDNNSNSILFALLRSALCGSLLSEQEKLMCSDELLSEMAAIAKQHDILHLLAAALNKNGISNNTGRDLSRYIIVAMQRYEQLNYELGKICSELEKAEIPFIPLKGSLLRKYYPEPWMRTSCDIDILIHEKDIEKAVTYLVDNCGYISGRKGSHDVSIFSPAKNLIELHYDLVEDGYANASSEVLRSVWDNAALRDGYNYWYEMTDEMFYFYHIAHMAKHFILGGCGIRTFIDIRILDNIDGKDQNKRDNLLKQGELLKFSEIARQLSRVWIDNEEHTEITRQMEDYILRGGVYGTAENRIAIQQQKEGGRFSYAMSRIFLPYDFIKFQYPVLQKHRWLTPVMEVCRWCKLIFCGRAKQSVEELRYNQTVSDTESDFMRKFLGNVGL